MLRQVSSYMAANIVSAIFGFASVILFTRILSPHEYGVYIVGFSVATMVSTVLFGWIKMSVARMAAENSALDLRLTAASAGLALLLLIPLLYGGIAFALPETVEYLLPAIVVGFAIGGFEFYLEIFRARQQTSAYMWSVITRAALALAISSLLTIVFDLGGKGLLLSIAASYVLSIVLFGGRVWQRPVRPFNSAILKEMLRFGLPMTVSSAIFMLAATLDRLVIGAYIGEYAAGIYGASSDFVRQVMQFPGVAVGLAISPIAIRLMGQGDRAGLDRHMKDSMEMLLAVLGPAAVGVAIASTKIAGLVLGEEFHQTAMVLMPIIVFAWLLRSISYQFVHVSFQLAKTPFLMGVQGVVVLGCNIAAMAVLVPRYGIAGAAWSMLISEVVGVVAGYLLSRKAYRLPIGIAGVSRVAAATAAMALPTYLVDRHLSADRLIDLIVVVLVGMVCYVSAAYALNVAGIRAKLGARRTPSPQQG